MLEDEIFMQRCLDLAIKGIGHVAPNPLVGCVIVNEGKIIGEGYHQQFGEPHAEVNAVNSVPGELRHLLPHSTLYVNLEPCSHYGKTPPCADMIVSNNIGRVVIGSNDPNPQVAGKGIKKLKKGGVKVVTGVLKDDCDFLNRRFLTFYIKHRPYIILKWAQSADGFMAPAEAKQLWLTGEESRKLTHQWRSEEQAIMVGKKTVEIDDPELTVRLVPGNNPLRITIDKNLSLPITYNIFSKKAPIVLYNELQNYADPFIELVKIDFKKDVLPQIMKHLVSREIQSIMVEGGPVTLQHFIETNLWDEARIFTTKHVLKSGKKAPTFSGKILLEEKIGKDELSILYNQ